MGHYIAARQRGLNVGAPAFVPFVGAWIALEDLPVDVETEAYVAIAGPVVGTIAALAVYLWARSEGSCLLLAISYSGLFLNLFNLLPISPLDGGRVTAVLSPRIWLLGAPVLLALMLFRPSPMLLIVIVLAAPQLMKAWRYDPRRPWPITASGSRPSSNMAPCIWPWRRSSQS
jgi:Zn-dependent protease